MVLKFGTILKMSVTEINFNDAAGLKTQILRLSKQKKIKYNL